MDLDPLSWAPALVENDLLIALAFFTATTLVIALWVPGVLLPIAASLGALLDAWQAAAVVSFGALFGSMIIFATTKRFAVGRGPPALASFVSRFEARFKSRGAWLVFGLRLVGTPHFLVSSGSALMRIKTVPFAVATLLGLFPTIILAAIAGSSIGP